MTGKKQDGKGKDHDSVITFINRKKILITKNKPVELDVTDLIKYMEYKITKINSLTEAMELIVTIINDLFLNKSISYNQYLKMFDYICVPEFNDEITNCEVLSYLFSSLNNILTDNLEAIPHHDLHRFYCYYEIPEHEKYFSIYINKF